jgi:hypothetical protein
VDYRIHYRGALRERDLMGPHPRIISEHGQPVRLKVWDGERDLVFPVSTGELRNLVADGFDILMREMREREKRDQEKYTL